MSSTVQGSSRHGRSLRPGRPPVGHFRIVATEFHINDTDNARSAHVASGDNVRRQSKSTGGQPAVSKSICTPFDLFTDSVFDEEIQSILLALNNKTSSHSNKEEATNDRSAYIDEQIMCFRESHSSKQSDIFAFRAYTKNLIDLVKPFSGLPEELKAAYTAIEEEIDKLNKDLRQASMEKRFDRVQELANQLMLCQMRLEQEGEREKDMFVNWTELCAATCDVITGNAQRLKQILIKSLEGSAMTRHEHSIQDHKGQADPIDPPPPYSVTHDSARSQRTSKRRRLSEDATEVSKLSQSKKEDKQNYCEEAAENAFSDREEAVTKSRQGSSGGMPRDTNVQEYTDLHTSRIPEDVSEWSGSLGYFDGDDSEDEDFRETRGVSGRKYHQWDCDCELCILNPGEAEEDDVS